MSEVSGQNRKKIIIKTNIEPFYASKRKKQKNKNKRDNKHVEKHYLEISTRMNN